MVANLIDGIIIRLVKEYSLRQEITKEAIAKFVPAMLEIHLARQGLPEKEQLLKLLSQIGQTQHATFMRGQEIWECYFHGLGCKILNVKTNEVIEWDTPDTNIFDEIWFVNWLRWRVSEIDDEAAVSVKKVVDRENITLEELVHEAFRNLIKSKSLNQPNSEQSTKFKIV